MNFDTKRNRVILAVLLVIAFALITVDLRGGDKSPLGGLRGFGAAVFGPIQRAVAAVVDPVVSLAGSIGDLPDAQDRIARLEKENAELRRQLNTHATDRHRAAGVDRLLRLAGTAQYRIVPAQVIAIAPAQGFSWAATIDSGTLDGLRADMTVISGDGLVGRVTSVGPVTSTVLLATDPTSTVGVRLAGSGEIGMVTGGGNSPLQLEMLNPQLPLKVGDRLVSFGSRGGKPFVPGLPIGEVISVIPTPGQPTRRAVVRSYVNFGALDVVGVLVQPPRTDPRDSLLPPVPAPPVTPPAQAAPAGPAAVGAPVTPSGGSTS